MIKLIRFLTCTDAATLSSFIYFESVFFFRRRRSTCHQNLYGGRALFMVITVIRSTTTKKKINAHTERQWTQRPGTIAITGEYATEM